MALKGFFLIFLIFTGTFLFAQEKQDTTKNVIQSIQDSRLSKKIMESITRSPSDTLFNQKSEDAFLPFTGKIIRKITIKHIGFDKTIYDTTRSIKNTVTKIGNALHTNSKEWVIRDNLFIREGKPLNPYKLADNERYLRDLDFILDARIIVKPVKGHRDMVDVTVVTRDVFSLGGSVDPSSATKYNFNIHDSNLAGWGQGLLFSGLVEKDRAPTFAPEFIYQKSSVGGSLANLSAGYTTVNTASSYGDENEYAVYFRLDRPLVSPYSRVAGAIEISRNWSQNVFLKQDTMFLNYGYNVKDFWIGYNIGINNSVKNRNRQFIAIRTFQQSFTERPYQLAEHTNPLYNDRSYVLGQYTFFNQNFYKTRYIYGFGRTEDVPYGKKISLLAGWDRQFNLNRPFVGASIERTVVQNSGDFYLYTLRAETFHYKNEFQDVSLLASASLTSRLLIFKNYKVRQYVRLSYTSIINPTVKQLLKLDNDFGVVGLRADSLLGVQRLGLHSETDIFTNWKLLGFRFAPIVFGDVAFLSKEHKPIFYDKPFFGLGAGIRTRNENLIFGTIELKGTYYPRVVEGATQFKISVQSNLRIKYTGTLVSAPSFIQYN